MSELYRHPKARMSVACASRLYRGVLEVEFPEAAIDVSLANVSGQVRYGTIEQAFADWGS